MIKVTDEMIADARDASAKLNGHCSTYLETRASLEAVMTLIDPVPDHVTRIYVNDGDDEFYRVVEGGNVWHHECGCCFSTYQQIVNDHGRVTWRDGQ